MHEDRPEVTAHSRHARKCLPGKRVDSMPVCPFLFFPGFIRVEGCFAPKRKRNESWVERREKTPNEKARRASAAGH